MVRISGVEKLRGKSISMIRVLGRARFSDLAACLARGFYCAAVLMGLLCSPASRASGAKKIILDTDPGTDDAMALMLALYSPELDVLEPVSALVQQGVAAGNMEAVSLLQGSGEALPFADGSFDVVSEFSILHHVPHPAAVVEEMLRVAWRAVVIVDCNRFAQGSWPARLFKLLLYKIGLWGAFNFVRTGGKRYQISEGDGLFY
jgi:SAM-dependent methyltransferase